MAEDSFTGVSHEGDLLHRFRYNKPVVRYRFFDKEVSDVTKNTVTITLVASLLLFGLKKASKDTKFQKAPATSGQSAKTYSKPRPLQFHFLIFRGDKGKRVVILCSYDETKRPKIKEVVLLRDGDKRIKREKIENAGYTHDGKYVLVGTIDAKEEGAELRLWSFRSDTGQFVPIEKASIEEGDDSGGYLRRLFLLPDRSSIVANRGGSSLHLLEHSLLELGGELEVTRFDLLTGKRERLTTGFLITARPFPHKQPKLTGNVYYQPIEGQFIGYVDLAGEQVNEIAYSINLPQSLVSFRFNRDKSRLLVTSSTRIGRGLVWTIFCYQVDDWKLIQSNRWQNIGYGLGIWSEDGRYALCENKWPSRDPVTMVIFSPQGNQLRRFTLPSNFHPTDWLGETIVGSYSHGDGTRLALVNAQSGALSPLPPRKVWNAHWLGGSNSLLALVTNGSSVLHRFDDSNWANGVKLWHTGGDFAISPDRKWIAFVTNHCPGLFIDSLERPGQIIQVSGQASGGLQWLER